MSRPPRSEPPQPQPRPAVAVRRNARQVQGKSIGVRKQRDIGLTSPTQPRRPR